jgi:DNA polymerase III delta subunit
MTIILHGENTIKSREKLVQIISDLKINKKSVTRLEAKKLDLANLEEELAKSSLFGEDETIVIEEIHSLPRSKKKDSLIQLLSNTDRDIVLWEKRNLTPTMLKKFPQARTEIFKISNTLFSWLDIFHPKTPAQKNLESLDKAIKSNGDYMCFVMLIRQIGLLIHVKDGGRPAGPPFMVSKIKKQASYFSMEKLLDIHRDLFEIDRKMKSSQSFMSMKQELDILSANLYS